MSKAIIIYETRSGNTEAMKNAIEEELKALDTEVTVVKIKDAVPEDLPSYDAVILGSPTYHHDLIPAMKRFLFKMEKVNLKGVIGTAFGSYGWTGEAVGMMTDTMKHIFEMDVIEPGLRIKRKPDKKGFDECKEFAKKISSKIN
ncbi:MAG: flavodoxin domain-containing protein [Halobacteriota archaeon]|nr:flavodoxin domain-containing protein [Halobacteriota archaeon]